MILAFSCCKGRLAPVFDVSRRVLVWKNETTSEKHLPKSHLFPSTDPFQKILWLKEQNVHTLFCGAISQPVAEFAAQQGVVVHGFLSGPLPEILLLVQKEHSSQYPNLESFLMPGCCRATTSKCPRSK